MAQGSSLPCDGDGICMVCKSKPSEDETLTCKTCVTPWHVNCLPVRPETLADTLQWECPDCSMISDPNLTENAGGKHAVAGGSGSSDDLIAAIRAIESDQSLTDQEKAMRRQKLMSGRAGSSDNEDANLKKGRFNGGNDVLNLFDERMNCSFCMQLPERPVTTPCGHNFCLKCFQKWVGQGKRTCANCRRSIPPKMASNPRINSALVVAIRMAKMTRSNASVGQAKVYHFIQNQNRPDSAFTTERAKKAGKANACSGKIFVTVPPDHFGPILAENDPGRNQGILVGETWEDRLECRQWGAHLPHVAGIAGQSEYGSQSVALSGGYEDDEDHGEWFLYTGSGGRDLSGNKRTNKTQSFDQQFEKMNAALKLSCLKGYPVRVVRSHKEKRSAYAPENGVRYDGIYRIEKCWRKKGIQGFRVCRYLFVRCDNDPAPWTSDEHGDRPRPLPVIKELKGATDIIDRKGSPSWDYDAEKCSWMWMKPPPQSRKQRNNGNFEVGKKVKMVRRQSKTMSMREKLLKEFSCLLCCKVMVDPLTTPCAHNFCKSCLEAAFDGQTFMKQRTCEGGRTLRAKKTIMKCPSCPNDISDFLQNPQINREMMGVIESLQRVTEEMEENSEKSSEEAGDTDEKLDEVDEIDEGTSICNAEIEENSEKSSEEAGDTDEKLIEVAKDANVCNVDSEILDDVKKCILDASTKTEPQKTCDQATDGNDVMNGGAKGTPVKPVASENNELQANVVAPIVKRAYKRKKAGDVDQLSVPVASENNELQANVVAPVVERAYKREKSGDVDQSSVPVASDNHEQQANMVAPIVKRAYKRKKAGDVDQSSVPVAPENNELQANVVAPVVKRAYKRKKAGDVDQSSVPVAGVKTRGRKAAELA